MTAAALRARHAYSESATRSPRATEFVLLSDISRRLRRAVANADTDHPELAAAIHANRRVWTALAADVADPCNALSPELRARVFYLARFCDAHSRKVLRDEADATVLLDINAAVLSGLAGHPGAA